MRTAWRRLMRRDFAAAAAGALLTLVWASPARSEVGAVSAGSVNIAVRVTPNYRLETAWDHEAALPSDRIGPFFCIRSNAVGVAVIATVMVLELKTAAITRGQVSSPISFDAVDCGSVSMQSGRTLDAPDQQGTWLAIVRPE